MRQLPHPSLFISLMLLLGACSGSAERNFNEEVAEANFKLGIGYMQSGHNQVATEKLLKAVQFKDNYPEAHNALGVLYEELREYAPAENHYKRAIELKSDYTLARLNYARFLCLREPVRTGEGEAELQRIIAEPANAGASAADAYAALGACALQRQDVAQAETWLRRSLELNPNNSSALLTMAQLSQQQGKTLPARAFIQRYHAQARPNLQSLLLGITIESTKEGDPTLRREYAAALVAHFPNSDEARRLKQPE